MDYNWIIKWLRRVVEHGDTDPQEYCTNRRCKEQRNCGTCHWYDPLVDCCKHLGEPCKEPERERWENG